MKRKAAIQRLGTKAKTISFPQAEPSGFLEFKMTLLNLLVENFGNSVREEFDFDETLQVFYWRVSMSLVFFQPVHSVVVLQSSFQLSPSLPLLEEFDRIEAEYDKLKRKRNEIIKHLIQIGAEL